MNFGDILEKWERTRVSKNIMEEWLRNNEIFDKDTNIRKMPKTGETRSRLLHSRPDGILDIHGLTSEKAWILLDHFFTNAKENGFEKLRIIHGKGNRSRGEPILLNTVRKYIEKCPFAGESGFEKAANGGTGATWVFLK